MYIETPRSKADEESDSVKDFFSVLFAYPVAEPTGNALTGIQNSLISDNFLIFMVNLQLAQNESR
jgi:hypothetical protein